MNEEICCLPVYEDAANVVNAASALLVKSFCDLAQAPVTRRRSGRVAASC